MAESLVAPQSSAAGSGGVQSVARAARLLACFADAERSLTLTELARRSGLTTSTAHRLLGTLCAEGLLCRDRAADGFLPGPLLLRLSRSSLLAEDLTEISVGLQALVDETRESACFCVRRGTDAAVLLAVSSPEALRVEVPAGTQAPLTRTAAGQALLAFGPAGLDATLDELGGEERSALRVDLLATQFSGRAVVDDALGTGIRAIAVPVRDRGVARAALELRGPRARMEDVDALVARLQRRAEAVARLPVVATL